MASVEYSEEYLCLDDEYSEDYSFLIDEDFYEEFSRSEQYVAVSIVFIVNVVVT